MSCLSFSPSPPAAPFYSSSSPVQSFKSHAATRPTLPRPPPLSGRDSVVSSGRASPAFGRSPLRSGLKCADPSRGRRAVSSNAEIDLRFSLAGGRGLDIVTRFTSSRVIVPHIGEWWRRAQGSVRETQKSSATGQGVDDAKEKTAEGMGNSTLLLHGSSFTPGMGLALPSASLTMGVSVHDLLACAITIAGALGLLKFFDELAKREVLEKKLSRKLVHIVVGLGYMLFWPLFSTASYAKFLCALAPGGNAIRMLGLGFGLLENESMVRAMSREGDRRELLKGPFYYALAIVVTTVCFWRTSPIGIVALVNLCAGDGIADIIGRNFGGKSRLPWNEDKSWAGSVSFFLASTGVSILYLLYFAYFGFLQMQPGIYTGVAVVSFLTAIVESLPVSTRLDDNLTVPFAAMVLGYFILPS
ncbi:hypothetical protein R1flu_017012 [Riccia fluitans]|uniref:Phytol kinase n=1 Tax=Riccia fluitans TaxID=41844 RepID=A0ABD1YNH5_9MARC